MYWACDRARTTAAVLLVGIGLAATYGCARPAGELFPARSPPRVWPAPPNTPRIMFLGEIADSGALHAGTSASEAVASVLRGSRPPIHFSAPHAVAVSGSDLVAVADSAGACVHILDLKHRTHVLVAGGFGTHFHSPVGVAWAKDRLFVTDAGKKEIIELDPQGGARVRFGGHELQRPVGITYVASRHQLYVVDGDAHQLKRFSPDGSYCGALGSRGAGPGEFNYPSHVTSHGDRLLVSDSGNFRVQLLTLDGEFLASIGQKGDAAGDFALPKGVAFDTQGHLYVVDARFENIQLFDERGQLLMALGEEGREQGEFSLPAGITVDELDRIWVADAGNRRLQVFQFLRNPL